MIRSIYNDSAQLQSDLNEYYLYIKQIAAILKMMGVKSCVLKKIYNLKLCWKIYFLCVVFVCNYFPIIDYREEEL